MEDFSSQLESTDFNLSESTLVEASAGTGKTYNIQNVYLRLILESQLSVEQILVVTFTEAATHELRERLRKILSKAKDYFSEALEATDEDFERIKKIALASRVAKGDEQEALSRLKLSLMDFDNAAVFTIHGFCKRILDRYTFECGHDPMAELMPDAAELMGRVCRDWWRKHTYMAGGEVAFDSLADLEAYLAEYIRRPEAKLMPDTEVSDEYKLQVEQELRTAVENIPKHLDSAGSNFVVKLPEFPLEDSLACCKVLRKCKVELGFPVILESLVAEASKIQAQVGSVSKFSWSAENELTMSKGTVDVSGFNELVRSHAADLAAWPGLVASSLKTTKAAKTILEALEFVRVPDFQTLDASALVKHIKKLGGATAKQLLSNVELISLCEFLEKPVCNAENLPLLYRAGTLRELAASVLVSLRKSSAITYNDLLGNVDLALQDVNRAEHLKKVLREEYKAALIDEFQDTDALQYRIFNALFNTGELPLVYVGDPKQAIFGFRGGDVFTYCTAKDAIDPDRHYHLGTNYRSEQGVISAVNELFKDRDSVGTFMEERIPYLGNLKASVVKGEKLLSPNERPFRVFNYSSDDEKIPGLGKPVVEQMYDDIANEMVGLINDDQLVIGTRRIRPCDIAVLVHTHGEGELIWRKLKERGVNAVRQSTGNVFDSLEARDLLLVMRAMLEPSNAYAVRGALASSLLPCALEELFRFCSEENESLQYADLKSPEEQRPQTLEAWMEIFKAVSELWKDRSFIEAFNALIQEVALRTYLVGLDDGERRLTNVLHLAELGHRAATDSQLSPEGLKTWFKKQLDGSTRDENSEYEIRLSSDEDAVKIMTIYKSKGLEFPIVFLPTLWRLKAEAKKRKAKMALYHDDDNQLIMDMASSDVIKEKGTFESLQENMRLIYVACTRAVNRVYLSQFLGGDENAYALTRLLNTWREDHNEFDSAISEEDREEVTGKCKLKPTGELIDEKSFAPAGVPSVDHAHGHTSFSGLEPNAKELQDTSVKDLDGGGLLAAESESQIPVIQEDIFSIPGGARTGNCWHDILEFIDFQEEPAHIASVVDEQVKRYKICNGATEEITEARCAAVQQMIQRVLAAPLCLGAKDTFSLRDIPFSARKSELEFHFSLRQEGAALRTPQIRDVLKKHWAGEADKAQFLEVLENWDKQLPLGFMTGFIDLVCCYKDRFYILDWKSNRRSGRLGDFGPSGLRDEMARHAYFLQYLFYSVALHGFLSRSLDGYSFEQHFGGVFYVFLRGVCDDPGSGIFADRPSEALIEDLAQLLSTNQEVKV